jgi:hypothetical protein
VRPAAREGVAAWCLDGREDRWRKELMWRMTRRGDVLVSTHPVSGFVTARLGTGNVVARVCGWHFYPNSLMSREVD